MGILCSVIVNQIAKDHSFIVLEGRIHVARTIIVVAIIKPSMDCIPSTIIVAIATAIAIVWVDGASGNLRCLKLVIGMDYMLLIILQIDFQTIVPIEAVASIEAFEAIVVFREQLIEADLIVSIAC